MTDVFFIAYEFPPLNRGGVFRSLKFVKYFNDFNIKPILFTLNPKNYKDVYNEHKTDNKLINELKSVDKEIIYVKSDNIVNIKKNKIKSFFYFYFNVLGVIHKNWEKYFFEEAEKKLKDYTPKAIIVTAPPFSIVELAVKLSKKTGIPLIIDMRDSFSMWVSQPFGSFFHYKLILKKEREWFNHAYKVLAVTQQMVNDWKSVHKNIPYSKYTVIPNGFDKKISFSDIIKKPSDKTFTIGYTGSFYYNPASRDLMFKPWYKKHLHHKLQFTPRKEDWLYRSPFFLFKTLAYLFKQKSELKNKIFIKFAGLKPDWFDEMVLSFGIEKNVEHLGFLTFEESVKFQNRCDSLLVTSVKVINGEDYCIAGKTFDYITFGKPILGFVTEGAQKQFLEQSGTGIICDPDDINGSVKILKDIFDNGITLKPNKEFIEKFHRKYLTEQLSELIYKL